jgi:hypothetical protein
VSLLATYLRTAAYVDDDHAQGSHTFADLLKGYLALCERENWTLKATKTLVGFPCINLFSSVFT